MKFLTTTAFALTALSTPALAEMGTAQKIDPSTLIIAGDITGGDIYTEVSDVPLRDQGPVEAALDSWEAIGEIEDIVLDQSGAMIGIIADVGGFLGIGDKHVLLPIDNVQIVPIAQGDDKYALVTRYDEEALMGLSEVEQSWFE